MRSIYSLLLVFSFMTCTGCAFVAQTLIEGPLNSIFNSDDGDIDPHILKRRGVEPGSKQHRELEAELRIQKHFDEIDERREYWD